VEVEVRRVQWRKGEAPSVFIEIGEREKKNKTHTQERRVDWIRGKAPRPTE
jgi:hypothetical protein